MFDTRMVRCCASLPFVLIALATAGCAPGLHSVRLRTADGREWTTVPRPHPPVAITQEEFQSATASLARDVVPVEDPLEFARQLFEVPVRSGWYFYDRRTKQITPLDATAAVDSLPADVVELTRSYLQWCNNRREPNDCLRLLRHGYALDADARFAVAMDIALGSVAEAVAANLRGVANADSVRAMIVASIVMYGVLLVAPEPISKLIAATMTAALVVYLGVDTLYGLRDGWRRLVARTDAAMTFDELRSAGEQFGKLMGANTARILVMVAAAALGSGAGGVAKIMPTLPGAGQALSFAAADGVEVGAVEAVAIADSGITLTLAPGAVAMSVTGSNSGEGNPGTQPSAAAGGAARSQPTIARITPGSLPPAEEESLLRTLRHIDAGTTPGGPLAEKWGTQFKNWAGDLPGPRGAASPYLEYRVAPPGGTNGVGPLRVVVNQQTGEMYYTWTHYGDMGAPAFVQIR